jgi:YidC/Oxa1 family membrane protein insertase
VQLVLEAEQGGVRLTKTFTFKRGDYVIGVRHDVTNSAPRRWRRRCTCSCSTTAASRKATPIFNSSYTGPTLYTSQDKYQKLTFEKIAKGKRRARDQGHRRLDRDLAALLRLGLHPAGQDAARHLHQEPGQQPVRHRHRAAAGHRGAGRDRVERARLYSGPQEEKMLERSPRAWNWCATTAGRPSSPSRFSGPWTSCTS